LSGRSSSAHAGTPKEAYEPAPWASTGAYRTKTALEHDFVHDQLANGQPFRVLTVVDNWSRESPVLEVGFRLTGNSVVETLSRVGKMVCLPACITVDHGTEFTSTAEPGVKLFLIEAGKPNQNAHIESFNGRFREECLNEHRFTSLQHAKVIIDAWQREYNEERPKKSPGGLTPSAYAFQFERRAICRFLAKFLLRSNQSEAENTPSKFSLGNRLHCSQHFYVFRISEGSRR
jgi:transposase InsO family protein